MENGEKNGKIMIRIQKETVGFLQSSYVLDLYVFTQLLTQLFNYFCFVSFQRFMFFVISYSEQASSRLHVCIFRIQLIYTIFDDDQVFFFQLTNCPFHLILIPTVFQEILRTFFQFPHQVILCTQNYSSANFNLGSA